MMKNLTFDEAMCFAYGSTMLTGGSSIGIMDNGEHYVPKHGYVVGGVVPSKSIEMDNEAHFKHTYNRFYYQAGLALERELTVIIGTWIDDDKIVFDLCNVIDDMKEALELAAKRGERAIYDLENEREIFVNYNA